MTDVVPPGVPPVERRHFPRRWRRARRALYGLLGLIALAVVGNLALTRLGGPKIGGLNPSPVRVGDTVTITGRGFDTTLEGNIVYFGDYAGRMVKASRQRLEVEVPDVQVSPGGKQVPLKVEVGEEVSDPVDITVLPPAVPEPGTEPHDDVGDAAAEDAEERALEAARRASPGPSISPTPQR
jgi:hypothetical protein